MSPLLAQSGHGPRQSRVTGTMERQLSLRLDIRGPDHLGPLLSFVGDKLAEVRRRACEYRAAEVSDPRFHLGIGESRIDLLVECVDDSGRRVPGCPEAEHRTRFVA